MKTITHAILCLLALLFISLPLAQAQDIDKTEAEKRVKKLFQDYEYYGTLVESFNDETVSESVIAQFKNLFDASATVQTDIKQSDSYGEKLSLTAYVNELKTWYPSGLSVSLSPPQLGAITCNKGRCQVTVPVTKSMGGLTKAGVDFRDSDILLHFVVGFDEGLQNFKILNIKGGDEGDTEPPVAVKPDKKPPKTDSAPLDKPSAKADKPKPDKPKADKVKTERLKPIKNKPVKTENVFAKGNQQKARRSMVGIYGGLGWTWLASTANFSPISGGNSEALSTADNRFKEDFSLGTRPLSYRAVLGLNRFGLTYQQYLGEKFGFTVGIGLHTYQSAIQGDISAQTYTVDNNETGSPETDNTAFTRGFEAKELKENYQYSSLELFLGAQYQWYSYVRNNPFRPYIKGGLTLAISSFAPQVTFDGNINSSATYRQNGGNYTLTYDESGQNKGKVFTDVYWIYGDNSIVSDRHATTELIPAAAALNISPTAELGFDWALDKSGTWFFGAAARLSMGLLSVFGSTNTDIYGNGNAENLLLKRHYTSTDPNLDAYYAYTPLSENSYEYRSIHGADTQTKPHFMGFNIALKYVFKKGK